MNKPLTMKDVATWYSDRFWSELTEEEFDYVRMLIEKDYIHPFRQGNRFVGTINPLIFYK